MSEDKKKKKTNGKLVTGVISLVLGLMAVIVWKDQMVTVFKGSIGIILVTIGIIACMIVKD